METTEQRIFWGGFSSDSDEFLLQQPPGTGPFVQVSYSPVAITDQDQRRVGSLADLHRQVSILGRSGEPVPTELGRLPSIIAEKIVSQEDIAQRAFEIYKSGQSGSTLDNWLLAERQLLGVSSAMPARSRG
jgi:hypothetical protein